MRKIILFLTFFSLFGLSAAGQITRPNDFIGFRADDPATCARTGLRYWNTVALEQRVCTDTSPVTWEAVGGSGGGMTIGDPVTGATANRVLHIDGAGNLDDTAGFTFNSGILDAPEIRGQDFSWTNGTQGSIVFIGASGSFTQNNAALFWNNADTQLKLTAGGATKMPLLIQLAAAQSADGFQILPNGSSTPLFKVDKDGYSTSVRQYFASSGISHIKGVGDNSIVINANGSDSAKFDANYMLKLRSDSQFIFSSTSDLSLNADTGIRRAAAGGIAFSVGWNGSTFDNSEGWFYARQKVTLKTASYTVSVNETNALLTNEGATASVPFTLPAAADGLQYQFCVQDADGLTITAAAGDTIRISSSVTAAAGTVTSTAIGSCVTLKAINATEWFAVSSIGTWTF